MHKNASQLTKLTQTGRVSAIMAVLVLLLLIFSLSKVITKHNDEDGITVHEDGITAPIEEKMNRLLEIKDVCFDMHIFLQDLDQAPKLKSMKTIKSSKTAQLKKHGLNETSLIAIMLGLLIISTLVSLADVLKVKREQKALGSTPDGDSNEKCSLAEFANMKRLRRESSFGGINSFKESASSRVATLCRFESVGSAFARMRRESAVGNVLSGTEVPSTPPVGPSRPPLKLLGARPAPLLRRSSFPASFLKDGIDQHRRRMSVDSEEDSSPDATRRRVRIIRRH